jgi:spoIIIJ-associated protein
MAETVEDTARNTGADAAGADIEGVGNPVPGDEEGGSADADAGEAPSANLIQEGDIAADYLERLLDIVDYDGDIDLDVENERAIVAIIGSSLQSLIGEHGETLEALQELTRLAVAQKTGNRSRLMLDISGHRQARRAQLTAIAGDAAERVRVSGESSRLAPMNPFERKVVHDAISGIEGVRSESEGEEPNRRVVVLLEG